MPTDNRVHITFRLAPAGRDWIDELAAKHRVTRTDVIRESLAIARAHDREVASRLELLGRRL